MLGEKGIHGIRVVPGGLARRELGIIAIADNDRDGAFVVCLRRQSPVELTRAALRRVWTSDPAIRDFVGLSENAWDFTDPNAMPGFGPLESTDEIRRMIAQVVDQMGEAARTEMAEVQESARDSNALSATGQDNESAKPGVSAPALPRENAAADSGSKVVLQSSKEDDAAQRDVTEEETKRKQFSQRTHGSALPR